jgi:hypothetical protein
MDITGKIVDISATQNITATFQKREFVVEYIENPSNPQYAEFIKFELIQDKCAQLDTYKVGQDIKVHFNLKGRKWTDPQGQVKYFNSLQAWRLEPAGAAQPSGSPASPESTKEDTYSDNLDDVFGSSEDDDLPF